MYENVYPGVPFTDGTLNGSNPSIEAAAHLLLAPADVGYIGRTPDTHPYTLYEIVIETGLFCICLKVEIVHPIVVRQLQFVFATCALNQQDRTVPEVDDTVLSTT
jgi:hypothetical protein